jgi:2',3'-cyclic-nucleotide 2'-phosphodiesterase (5'-nucleotidase family)
LLSFFPVGKVGVHEALEDPTVIWCQKIDQLVNDYKLAEIAGKVEISSIKIEGTPIDPDGTYRVAANTLLAEGGDGFSTFSEGVNRICGISDMEARINYLMAFSPVSPSPMDRISVVEEELTSAVSAQMASA